MKNQFNRSKIRIAVTKTLSKSASSGAMAIFRGRKEFTKSEICLA